MADSFSTISPMSEIYLTDIVIHLEGDDFELPTHSNFCLSIRSIGVPDETTEPLCRASSTVWKLDSVVPVPVGVSSFEIFALVRDQNKEDTIVGSLKCERGRIEQSPEFAENFVRQGGLSMRILANVLIILPSQEESLVVQHSGNTAAQPFSFSTPSDEVTDSRSSYLGTLGRFYKDQFERSGNPLDNLQAISLLEDAVATTPDTHPDKPDYLRDLGFSLTRRFEQLNNLNDLRKAISALKNAVGLTPDGAPSMPVYLSTLGHALMRLSETSQHLADADEAILAHENCIRLARNHNVPYRMHVFMSNLGNAFTRRYTISKDITDISKAISAHEAAVGFLTHDTPEKAVLLSDLSASLASRFEELGDPDDLDQAIKVERKAVELLPITSHHAPMFMDALGCLLVRRYHNRHNREDLDDAVPIHQTALSLLPDGSPRKAELLGNLGVALSERYTELGELSDMESGISAYQSLVESYPQDSPSKLEYTNNLGVLLRKRFERLGNLSDIDVCISLYEDALHLVPQDDKLLSHALWRNLGVSLTVRYEHSGDVDDIQNAIGAYDIAETMDPGNREPGFLDNVAVTHVKRYERFGDIADLDKAISVQEEAANVASSDRSLAHIVLNNLGSSLARRFQRIGDVVDIDRAISSREQAIQLTPEGHPDRPGYLSNLGLALQLRFQRLGNLDDIDKAISVQEQAVELLPVDHPSASIILNCLGISFINRYERLKKPRDIEKAASVLEAAVSRTSDSNPEKPPFLNDLGRALMLRAQHLHHIDDVIEAISRQEEADHLLSDGDTRRWVILSNLGNSFSLKCQFTRDTADIDSCISTQEAAVHLLADGHREKASLMYNLGQSMMLRLLLLADTDAIAQINDLSDIKNFSDYEQLSDIISKSTNVHQAIHWYRSAATYFSGAPSIRLKAAREWARLTSVVDPSQSLDAYATALDLLPRVAWLGQTITARHVELASVSDLPSEAAAAALSLEEYELALEWLEQGRCIVWTQLHQLRNPLDDLRVSAPSLADEFSRVSNSLEGISTRNTVEGDLAGRTGLSQEEAAQKHRRLAEEWERLLIQIRAIPGFEDFLGRKKVSHLSKGLPAAGPIVVINTHPSRCDALGLVSDGDNLSIIPIPLPRLSYKKALTLQRQLNTLLSLKGVRMRDMRAMELAVQGRGKGLGHILSVLWVLVVRPILEGLAFSELPATLPDHPRIWWYVTGPLVFLPIHAAGDYSNTHVPGSKLSDFVVSSYTPTLRAIQVPESGPTARQFKGIIGISQPNTPGQSALPSTKDELLAIRSHISPAFGDNLLLLEGPEATVDSVLRGLEMHSWAHFACHAIQNVEPTKSAFCLHDGRLELSTIIQKSFPYADFAFLSACQTSTGDERLPEEAVHLAAGMLSAGFRGVIATMWSIRDQDAPVVADEVYSYLLGMEEKHEPGSGHAAFALHHAVRRLCEKVGEESFLSWVPFIHVGL